MSLSTFDPWVDLLDSEFSNSVFSAFRCGFAALMPFRG